MKQLFLVLCLIIIACAAAQAQDEATMKAQQTCGDLRAYTGQAGWMLVSGPPLTAPIVPVNVTSYTGWANPLAGTGWISVDANRGKGATHGDYTYEYSFCVCRYGQHILRLSFYAEKSARVILNTTQILPVSSTQGAPRRVIYSGPALVPGTNTLRIVVQHKGDFTGLDAYLLIEGARAGCCQ